MFDRISIRTKLIAIVAAPLAVIIALAAVGFVQRRADAAATRADLRRLEAIEATQVLQHELQREALFSVVLMASEGSRSDEVLSQQRARTDRALADLERAGQALDPDEPGVARIEASLRQVHFAGDNLRTQVDRQGLEWQWTLELFGTVERSLPEAGRQLAAAIQDGELLGQARGLTAMADYSSWQARTGTLLAGAVEVGSFPTPSAGVDLKQLFDDAFDSSQTQLAILRSESAPSTRIRLRNQMAGEDLANFTQQASVVRGLPSEADLTIPPDHWIRSVTATLTQLREIASSESAAVLGRAEERLGAAEDAARLFLAGAVLAVLLAVGLAISVAASIARPVRQLTAAADRVATEQLPKLVVAMRNPAEDDLEHFRSGIDELEVTGGPELARLTASVNAIQEVAVEVATEQASLLRKGIGEMFVNLARRNQGLLDRQLSYIDELEAMEEDPDQLEHLFKLDHMATRMRRNAESLLILAGAEPNRRRGEPVPLTKVAMAAVGEIESFARIELLDIDEAPVVSQAAADIAHLLSELMENATQFSPPDTTVEVVGHRGAEGYTLSITDRGIGMTEQQLAEANELLARPPLLGLTLARSLGFIVVSRLAARHRITVRLVPSPAGGVTAIVILPSATLAPTLPTPGSAPAPDPERRAPVPAGTTTIPSPSTILPPLELGGPLDFEDAPATLAEAVPTGRALADGLDGVATPDATVVPLARRSPTPPAPPAGPTGPVPHRSAGMPAQPGALPSRRRTGPEAGPVIPPAVPMPPARPVAPTMPVPPAPAGAPEPLPAGLVGPPLGSPTPAGGSTAPRLFGPIAGPGPDGVGRPGGTDGAAAGPPQTTAAGLVRRVPRRAGANRAVPGGEGGRGGATTSVRSPDEVRSMLARFQSGRQAGQTSPPGTPDPDPHR